MKKPADSFDSEMMHKMAYVHAVTLFEAMVGDVLKATILAYPTLMQKMVNKLGEDKSNKFHITEIAELGFNGIVLGILNQQIYQNTITVKKYVNLIAGKVLPDTHMQRCKKLLIGHDFVYRNGRTTKGTDLEINGEMVFPARKVIKNLRRTFRNH